MAVGGITLASIVIGIVLSIIGSFVCHSCAFGALYDLRMSILNHMGRLNLGFFTGGQSGAVQKTMNDNIEKMENMIAHDVSNLIGAGLLLVSLSVLLFSINVPLAVAIVAALTLAFIIQFSAFGGSGGRRFGRISTVLHRTGRGIFRVCVRMEEEKIFGKPETAALRLTGLIEKNRKSLMAYLKRVTPIYGAYKTITLSVLAFLLAVGCVLLYLNPGDHGLMMELLMFLIVGPAVISPLMELVEFGADLRNLAVRMDQIEDVMKMEPMAEGAFDTPPVSAELAFQDVSFSYQKRLTPCAAWRWNMSQCTFRPVLSRPWWARRAAENPQPGSCWQGFGTWKAAASRSAEGIYGTIPPGPLWMRSPLCSRIPICLPRARMTISPCTGCDPRGGGAGRQGRALPRFHSGIAEGLSHQIGATAGTNYPAEKRSALPLQERC